MVIPLKFVKFSGKLDIFIKTFNMCNFENFGNFGQFSAIQPILGKFPRIPEIDWD